MTNQEIQTIDHIAIVVTDVEKVIKTWQQIFAVKPFNVYDLSVPGPDGNPMVIRHADGYLGNLKIQLLQFIKGAPPSGVPEGLAHIGIWVDDLEGEVSNLTSRGAKILLHNPGQLACLDCGGYSGLMFELIQKGAEFTVV